MSDEIMSERIHEQISAFLDDELSSEESAFLVRRLTSDTLAHQQTIRYATIGSVLRDESVLANSKLLRDRVHAVLTYATEEVGGNHDKEDGTHYGLLERLRKTGSEDVRQNEGRGRGRGRGRGNN